MNKMIRALPVDVIEVLIEDARLRLTATKSTDGFAARATETELAQAVKTLRVAVQ